MSDETIVAVFDTETHADAAVRDLVAANVPSDAISKHARGAAGTESAADASGQKQGFWSRTFGGEPDHDTAVYDRSLEAGSTVVTVKTPDQYVTAVEEILERHNPIDIDERAAGYGLSQTTPTRGAASETARGTAAPNQNMQLSEEQLVVGKRLVNRGSTRIRRFVVEKPVEEQVTLQEETVHIERRPVQSGQVSGDAAFTDKTIEVTETGEEAVVGKSARVYEEVAVRKDSNERVETVKDTVRREEVEVTKGTERDPTRT